MRSTEAGGPPPAQVSQLWDELHMRQPWRNAVRGGNVSSLQAAELGREAPPRYLAVIAINTVRAPPQTWACCSDRRMQSPPCDPVWSSSSV